MSTMTLERRGDDDRIDSLRKDIADLAREMRLGFQSVVTERQVDRDYLRKVLFEGNGRPALYVWLQRLQDDFDSRKVKSEKDGKRHEETVRDVKGLAFEVAKDAAKWAVAFGLAIAAYHGLFGQTAAQVCAIASGCVHP